MYGNHETKESRAISGKILGLSPDDELTVSILSLFELEYSRFLAATEKQTWLGKVMEQIGHDFVVAQLEKNCASIYAGLEGKLKRQRNIKPENMKRHNIDLMIAGTALLEGCVLVGGDSVYKDIQSINPDFRLESWTVRIAFKP